LTAVGAEDDRPDAAEVGEAAVSQPATTANSNGTIGMSTRATTSPMEARMATRRNAGACQPIHRWYRVGGGVAVIVGVLPMPSAGASSFRGSCPVRTSGCLLTTGAANECGLSGSLTYTDAEMASPHLIALVIAAASRGARCRSRGPFVCIAAGPPSA
jgi:hypothetical protein